MKSSSSRPTSLSAKAVQTAVLQAEAAAQAAGDVVFAAAFPDLELARRAHAPFARVQPQHDFPQRDQVVFARTIRFDVQHSHKLLIRPGHLAKDATGL